MAIAGSPYVDNGNIGKHDSLSYRCQHETSRLAETGVADIEQTGGNELLEAGIRGGQGGRE